MVTLSDLRNISNDIEYNFKQLLTNATPEELAAYEKVYNDILNTLEDDLVCAAIKGCTNFEVYREKRHATGLKQIISDDLNKKISNAGNLYVAWKDKKITQTDVKLNMLGNFKRIYKFLDENGLEPIISPGISDFDEFKIVISWDDRVKKIND